MVEHQENIGLHELCLDRGGAHRQQRLLRKDGRSLRHGVNVAGEAEGAQIVQKFLAELLPSAQIGNVLFAEMEVLNVGNDLLQARRDRKAAAVRHVAEKHVEIAHAILHAVVEVAVSHGQLVEIAEHRHVQMVVMQHNAHLIR